MLAASCNKDFGIISIDSWLQHNRSWRVRIIQIFHCPICSKCRFLQLQPATKLCNILQHLQQYATKLKQTVSGQIEPALSNRNGPRFVWADLSTLTADATSCNEPLSFCSEWSFFKHAYIELLVLDVVFCAGIRFWDAISIYRGLQHLEQIAMLSTR